MNGTSNFDNYNDDVGFITSGNFDDASINNASNYRSLIIDDWSVLANASAFDNIRLSLYKNHSLVAFYVFGVSNDKFDWFSGDNLIYSSYRDLYYETWSTWNIAGMFYNVVKYFKTKKKNK